MAASCAAHDAEAERRLTASERELRGVQDTYAIVEADHREVKRLAGELDFAVEAARSDWARTSSLLEHATKNFGEASSAFSVARSDYDHATVQFRRATMTIILAAASDLFIRGVCGPEVSTARYRRHMESEGINIQGRDVDHILARSRGGPDRPWNYMMLDQSINRSLQAGGIPWKLMNFPLNTLDALAKSASHQLMCQ